MSSHIHGIQFDLDLSHTPAVSSRVSSAHTLGAILFWKNISDLIRVERITLVIIDYERFVRYEVCAQPGEADQESVLIFEEIG